MGSVEMGHTRVGITFAVDEVVPAASQLEEWRTYEAVERQLGARVESCCDYHGTVVKDVQNQALLAAVHLAFSQHRPLVLTPDAVWVTIAQGVAQHMAIHGERLRSRFVSHAGRVELRFECEGWVAGSPENPWGEAFESWAGQIAGHVGKEMHDMLLCDFSTTGPVERAVSRIVMMDTFERYFHYVLVCICGIPTVTLEGTAGDWERLREKVEGLRVFEMDWWLEHLIPICDQFVRASKGDVDLEHWRGICKLRSEYGGDVINGWVAKLFPYLRAFYNGPCNRRNPIFETGEGFTSLVAPSGLSRVPFTWRDAVTGKERKMEAVGGLVGVEQDEGAMGLRPKVGWAVKEGDRMEVLLGRLTSKEHRTFAPARIGKGGMSRTGLPEDLSRFYHRTNGAELFVGEAAPAVRIVPARQMKPLDWGEDVKEMKRSAGPGGRVWHRFAYLADGSWLAINCDHNKHLSPWRRDPVLAAKYGGLGEDFAPICHGSDVTRGQVGKNPVVALSFGEWLVRVLENGGRVVVPEGMGEVYGDAERYTRRK